MELIIYIFESFIYLNPTKRSSTNYQYISYFIGLTRENYISNLTNQFFYDVSCNQMVDLPHICRQPLNLLIEMANVLTTFEQMVFIYSQQNGWSRLKKKRKQKGDRPWIETWLQIKWSWINSIISSFSRHLCIEESLWPDPSFTISPQYGIKKKFFTFHWWHSLSSLYSWSKEHHLWKIWNCVLHFM